MLGQPGELCAAIDPDRLVTLHYDVRAATPSRLDLGAIGHGPVGPQLAACIVDQIGEWDRNRTADPELFAYPVGTPMPGNMSGKVKRHRQAQHSTPPALPTARLEGQSPAVNSLKPRSR